MKKICTVLLLSLVLVTAFGQEKPKGKWAVGMYTGPTMLFGSMSSAPTIHGFDLGFLGQKALTNALSLRIDGGYAQYKDLDDKITSGSKVNRFSAYRDGKRVDLYSGSQMILNYKTFTYYGDLLLQANLPLHSLYGKEKHKFNVYVFGGVGLVAYAVKGNLYDEKNGGKYNFSGTAQPTSRKEAKDLLDGSASDSYITNPGFTIGNYKLNTELVGGLGGDLALNEKWELFGEARFGLPFQENAMDGQGYDHTGARGRNDIVFSGRIGAKYRFHKNDKNAIDWFDNSSAMHYAKTKALEDKIDGIYSDADGDGVPDYLDKEPNTPAGAGVDGSGRAMDADYDGIPDYADDDLFTPKGGAVDAKGNGVDSDGDGVPDAIDLEPNTPAGSLVNFQGIAIADGINAVPSVPSIFFGYNSSRLNTDYISSLASVIAQLNGDDAAKVLIVGHTDYVGSEKFNYTLGMRRAEAVKDALVKAGVDESKIMTDSKGKDTPLAAGKYKVSSMMNRRAELKIVK